MACHATSSRYRVRAGPRLCYRQHLRVVGVESVPGSQALVHPIRGVRAGSRGRSRPPRGGDLLAPRQRRVPARRGGRGRRAASPSAPSTAASELGGRRPSLLVQPGVLLEVLDLLDDGLPVRLPEPGQDLVRRIVGVHLVTEQQEDVRSVLRRAGSDARPARRGRWRRARPDGGVSNGAIHSSRTTGGTERRSPACGSCSAACRYWGLATRRSHPARPGTSSLPSADKPSSRPAHSGDRAHRHRGHVPGPGRQHRDLARPIGLEPDRRPSSSTRPQQLLDEQVGRMSLRLQPPARDVTVSLASDTHRCPSHLGMAAANLPPSSSRPRSSGDKSTASGAVCAGSNPAEAL